MTFRGWPIEALEFYEGLTADNSKSYWSAHLAVYEQQVRAPMEELLALLEPEFGPGRIFRPYRDVRFSKDKSPYKNHLAASLPSAGYIQLSQDGLAVGSGMYQMSPEQLERYRRAVASEATGTVLAGIIATIEKAGIGVLGRDTLKTVPRAIPRTTRASRCCATKAWSAGRNGPPPPGWARRRPRSGSSGSCGRAAHCGSGSQITWDSARATYSSFSPTGAT